MKYGESAFIILYLLFAVCCGLRLLGRGGAKARLMGVSALALGLGDAFHLVPRVLDHFMSADFTAALGIGKMVTSVTVTVFYLLLYYIWLRHYRAVEDKRLTRAIWALALLRVILCLFPQNGWLSGGGTAWAVIRNAPFVIMGAAVCAIYYKKRNKERFLKRVWLYVLLSFAFYIPVAVGASKVPMLGMLMVPKTVCYILMLIAFNRCAEDEER